MYSLLLVVTLAHFKTLRLGVAALRKDFMLVPVINCLSNTRFNNVATLEGLVPVDQNMPCEMGNKMAY